MRMIALAVLIAFGVALGGGIMTAQAAQPQASWSTTSALINGAGQG